MIYLNFGFVVVGKFFNIYWEVVFVRDVDKVFMCVQCVDNFCSVWDEGYNVYVFFFVFLNCLMGFCVCLVYVGGFLQGRKENDG